MSGKRANQTQPFPRRFALCGSISGRSRWEARWCVSVLWLVR